MCMYNSIYIMYSITSNVVTVWSSDCSMVFFLKFTLRRAEGRKDFKIATLNISSAKNNIRLILKQNV